jgi:hypothetical protein
MMKSPDTENFDVDREKFYKTFMQAIEAHDDMINFLCDLVCDYENYPKRRGAINRVLINVCGCSMETLLKVSRTGRHVVEDAVGRIPYAPWETGFDTMEEFIAARNKE